MTQNDSSDSSPDDLNERILRRYDRDGELSKMLPLLRNPVGRLFLKGLGRATHTDVSKVLAIPNQVDRLLQDQADSIRLLAPMGWAPTSWAPMDLYRRALSAYRSGGPDAAEAILVEGWNQDDRLRFAIIRIHVVGAGTDRLHDVGHARRRLVEKALDHHRHGKFEASVPIVLAQIDGVVQDFVGKNFFDIRNTYMRDELSLLGLPESLEEIWKVFNATSSRSESTGSLSRHAVMHGRELGYDTLANSTKSFILLSAVLDWCLPKSQLRAQQDHDDKERMFAGTKMVDADGRRMDRRGFVVAKRVLGDFCLFETIEYREHGSYSRTVPPRFLIDYSKYSVDSQSPQLWVNDEADTYSVWASTPSGFIFGEAVKLEADRWRYAGESPPTYSPEDDPSWRHILRDPSHPDW